MVDVSYSLTYLSSLRCNIMSKNRLANMQTVFLFCVCAMLIVTIFWSMHICVGNSNSSDCSYGFSQLSGCHWTNSYFLSFTTGHHRNYQYRIKGPWVNIIGEFFFKNIVGLIFKEISIFNFIISFQWHLFLFSIFNSNRTSAFCEFYVNIVINMKN